MSDKKENSGSSQAKEPEKSGSGDGSKAKKPNEAPPLKPTSQQRFDGGEYVDPDKRAEF